jgi:beta-lactamase superfamily II metal-dependent hydrolase
MFEIEMLPAREGDCLWLRYGSVRKPYQILIDGGRASTAKELRGRLRSLPPNQKTFELLIVTHVDRDHIEGILQLLEDPKLSVRFKDIWFNGYDHLRAVKLETFGAVQGERLSTALINRKLSWNRLWKRKAVCLGPKGLKTIRLPGAMTLTLLSPDRAKLTKLIPVWEKECKKAGLIPGSRGQHSGIKGLETLGGIDVEQLALTPFKTDKGEPNGSSIAVLASYGGKKALLAGDAHADRIIESIKIYKKSAKRLKLDAFKVAHHASEHNVSRQLIELVDCRRFLVSTKGAYLNHPTPAALARILKFGGKGAQIFFNYRNDYTRIWDVASLRRDYRYEVVYPKKSNGSLTVKL